jgi:hypothetical protein
MTSVAVLHAKGEQWLVTRAFPADETMLKYLESVAKLDPRDARARLGFYWQYLSHANRDIADDAFLEFAKASDAEILQARQSFDATQLSRWLADPKTPPERIGVYAMLLGLTGQAEAAAVFPQLLQEPWNDRARDNLGGLLCGWVLLDPAAGWKKTGEILRNSKVELGLRYSALGTVRFLQANHAKHFREAIMRLYQDLLADRDLTDILIDDLRRWRWNDLSESIVAIWDTKPAQVLKKAILRYALTIEDRTTASLLKRVRSTDPDLVSAVSKSLKLLEEK